MTARKIVQCWYEVYSNSDSSCTHCLCDDGTIWFWLSESEQWVRHPTMSTIPQHDVTEEKETKA